MPRIFLSLSITALLLIAAALTYGLMGGDYNGISNRYRALQSTSTETLQDGAARLDAALTELRPIQRHVRIHMLLGILAALMAVLVQSIGVTYFIGTGRWCKEVVEAYQLDEQFVRQHAKLKRQAFPFALLGIAAVLTQVQARLEGASQEGVQLASFELHDGTLQDDSRSPIRLLNDALGVEEHQS